MTVEKADLNHLKRGMAVLALCIVRTMHESDPTYRARFLKNLDDLYRDLRDQDSNLEGLELLSWVDQLVKDDRI